MGLGVLHDPRVLLGLQEGHTLIALFYQQLLHEVPQLSGELRREPYIDLSDLPVRLSGLLGLERRTALRQLIGQYSQAPQVGGLVVIASLDHLRREIVHRATESITFVVWRTRRPAEVADLEHVLS